MIINPNNPTGALYPTDILKQIVKIAQERGLIIFSDEIYDKICYDGANHVSTIACRRRFFGDLFRPLQSLSHRGDPFRMDGSQRR